MILFSIIKKTENMKLIQDPTVRQLLRRSGVILKFEGIQTKQPGLGWCFLTCSNLRIGNMHWCYLINFLSID